ncbi:MAG: NusA-like transcription termination signal-binding factor [Desulfurococcales archaeon]|nr:NusA-like transcription termination signal-binding factor [Desulfurococcales archaeon]
MSDSGEDVITMEELKYLSIFQEFTDAMAYRCIIDEDGNRLIFLVDSADVGKAIGRNGKKVRMLSEIFKKNVEVVAYSEDLEQMIRNLFPGVKILSIDVQSRGDEKSVIVKVAEEDKARAIGREGKNVKRARLVLKKLFNVTRLQIR